MRCVDPLLPAPCNSHCDCYYNSYCNCYCYSHCCDYYDGSWYYDYGYYYCYDYNELLTATSC